LVLDELKIGSEWGAGVALTTGYAKRPFVLRDEAGNHYLSVVSDQAFFDIGTAASYRSLRLYMNLASPVVVSGQSGEVNGTVFKAPEANLDERPDTIVDARFGVDWQFFGAVQGPVRMGASLQVFVPTGARADYLTDGTYRSMAKVLFAGDTRRFAYAAQCGVHIRPLTVTDSLGAPRGNEFLFAGAFGTKVVGKDATFVVGPEFFGATAFDALFRSNTTAIEALMSARIDGIREDGSRYRVKLGWGPGVVSHFGAPSWRAVLGFEWLIQRPTVD
jgi:hypothetical protein